MTSWMHYLYLDHEGEGGDYGTLLLVRTNYFCNYFISCDDFSLIFIMLISSGECALIGFFIRLVLPQDETILSYPAIVDTRLSE